MDSGVDDVIPVQPSGPSPADLETQADLVAHVQVLSIRWAPDRISPHLARLKLKKITKGTPHYRHPWLARLRIDRTIEVRMRRIKRDNKGRPLPGEWGDGYRAGDRVITHLVWDAEASGYLTLSWNAVWQTPPS
jgi:hypothetical protein